MQDCDQHASAVDCVWLKAQQDITTKGIGAVLSQVMQMHSVRRCVRTAAQHIRGQMTAMQHSSKSGLARMH